MTSEALGSSYLVPASFTLSARIPVKQAEHTVGPDGDRRHDSRVESFFSLSFNAGFDPAIQEVSDAVAGYIALQKSGDDADPWEVWLPNFLELVSKGDCEECRADPDHEDAGKLDNWLAKRTSRSNHWMMCSAART